MARFLVVFLVFAYLGTASAGWKVCVGWCRKYERVLDEMTPYDRFQTLDNNHDDFVTFEEWIKNSGKEDDFEEFLEYVDENGDGKISLAEFKKIYQIRGINFHQN